MTRRLDALCRGAIRKALIVAALLNAPAAFGQDSGQTAATARLEQLITAHAATGNDAEALALAEALLLQDPENSLAHFAVANILLRHGNRETALQAARLAFKHAQTDRQHYESARLSAMAALQSERFLIAQYWTRHSYHYAPTDKHRAIAAADFRRLRQISPWNASLRFGIRPTDNANGGAQNRLNVIDGIDLVGILSDDALALPGIVATANGEITYRLAQSQTAQTRIGFSVHGRAVELSGRPTRVSTSPTNPGQETEIRNSDYSEFALGVNVAHLRKIGRGKSLGLAAETGQTWRGGAQDYHYGLLSAQFGTDFGKASRAGFWGSLETRDRSNAAWDETLQSFGAFVMKQTGHGELSFSIGSRHVSSENGNARSHGVFATASYEPNRQIGPLSLAFTAALGKTTYPDYTVLFFQPPGGRQDETASAEIALWAADLGYAALLPELRLQMVRTHSNISRFDRSEAAISVGLRSAF